MASEQLRRSPMGNDVACRLCESSGLIECLRMDNAPSSVERLLRDDQLNLDSPANIRVLQCIDCGFVQLPDTLGDEFYNDYEMAVSFSPGFKEYLRNLADSFVIATGVQDGNLLEIGCGDGTFLSLFQDLGFSVTGIEPSRRFRKLAESKGLSVHDLRLGNETVVPGGPFDLCTSRQVLEHVSDVHGFLSGFRRTLTPGGVGLIEVPNLKKSVDQARFFDFFCDHVNYFSRETLRRACESNGLTVLKVIPTFHDEYITAFVRRPEPQDMRRVGEAMSGVVSQTRLFIENIHRNGGRVAIWGSGGKGVTLLAIANLKGIAYLVDSDPRKHGLFTPVSHLLVHSPERLKDDPVDAVLVTALAHQEEIVTTLRGLLKFNGEIMLLGGELRVME